MAMELPAKTLKALDKVCRGFLWCTQKEASGGSCLVAWEQVCTPKWAGGLGIPNLRWLNHALQARWLWLRRTDQQRPWKELDIPTSDEAKAIFQAAVFADVGRGDETLFWEDRWLDGYRIQDLAPAVYDMVATRIKTTRTVEQALQGNTWARDVGPVQALQAFDEYLRLWQRIATVELTQDTRDSVRWAWETNGVYSARSAYLAKFIGREVVPYADAVWEQRAPLQCRFFTWLAMRNRCWTSDRLARRDLPHQSACPLCDQHTESIRHILLNCVLSRTVWAWVWTALGRLDQAPGTADELVEWCTTRQCDNCSPKDLKALITLTLWEIWKHRNDVVFDGASPSTRQVIKNIDREGRTWRAVGLLKGEMDFFFGGISTWVGSE